VVGQVLSCTNGSAVETGGDGAATMARAFEFALVLPEGLVAVTTQRTFVFMSALTVV
jgi:hypothetical protein